MPDTKRSYSVERVDDSDNSYTILSSDTENFTFPLSICERTFISFVAPGGRGRVFFSRHASIIIRLAREIFGVVV